MNCSLIFYSENTGIATLYKQHLKDFDFKSKIFQSNWFEFLKSANDFISKNKILIIDLDSKINVSDIGNFYFDINSFFIFLSNEKSDKAKKKVIYPESKILPIKYVFIEKSSAMNRIKDDIKDILSHFSVTGFSHKDKDKKFKSNVKEMLKFYVSSIEKVSEIFEVNDILERMYLQIESFVDIEKIQQIKKKLTESGPKSVEEIFFLEENQFKCPVCQTEFQDKILNYDKLNIVNDFDDFYQDFSDINFFSYELTICPSCLFTVKSKDFSINLRQLIRDKIKRDKPLREKIYSKFLKSEKVHNKNILRYELSVSTYNIFRPDYFTATIELRKYWIAKYLLKDESLINKFRDNILELLIKPPFWSNSDTLVKNINVEFLYFYLLCEKYNKWNTVIDNSYKKIVKNNKNNKFRKYADKIKSIFQAKTKLKNSFSENTSSKKEKKKKAIKKDFDVEIL